MSSFQITKVKTVKPSGSSHEHIAAVETSTGVKLSRATVVADLKNPYGDRYYTYAGGQHADVILHHCPHCYASDYITTAPDSTTKNNLLDLPRFN
jgi:hypothetical protein